MKKNTMILNMLLAVVLTAGLMTGMIFRTFQPNVVLPNLDIPAMAALILTALLLEYLTVGTQKRAWVFQMLLAAVTFAALPFAVQLPSAGVETVVCSTVAFVILTWLFDQAAERLSVVSNGKVAMIPTAFVLYLACQSFMGMIL